MTAGGVDVAIKGGVEALKSSSSSAEIKIVIAVVAKVIAIGLTLDEAKIAEQIIAGIAGIFQMMIQACKLA